MDITFPEEEFELIDFSQFAELIAQVHRTRTLFHSLYLTIIHQGGSEKCWKFKYSPLTPTVRLIIVLVYTTQVEKIATKTTLSVKIN